MIVKTHKDPQGRMILAVCDSVLAGKTFEEGDAQLDLTSDFYKGEEKNKDEVADLMRNAYILNLVGTECVKLALDEEIIDPNEVKEIQKIPYAQSVLAEG